MCLLRQIRQIGFAHLQADQGENASLLERLRDFHPFLAVAVAAFMTYAAMLMPGYRIIINYFIAHNWEGRNIQRKL